MRFLVALALLALTACERGPQVSADAAPVLVGRPTVASDTITVEGDTELIRTRLVRYEGIAVPFSAYVPSEWSDDVHVTDDGTAVRFMAGAPTTWGTVSLFFPAADGQATIVDRARAVAERRGGATPIAGLAEGLDGFAFSDRSGTGTVRVGTHAGTAFYVVEEYDADKADGFTPRARMVLGSLRWSGDETAL